MKVVIIGGGLAGISVATHLRRRNENSEIVILEKNNEFAVSASALPYLLSGTISKPEDIIGATVNQMKQIFKIDVKLNHEVIDIDRKNKILTLEGKPPLSYDKLVLATGASQLRPDIEGILADNIFTIRDLRSIDTIKTYYEAVGAKKILILGAGNIGLNTAEAFASIGAEILVVEKESHIIPYLDPEMTRRIENRLQNFDVKLYLGKQVVGFHDGFARLSNGARIKYDLAVITTGVRPDVKLPIMADINLGQSGGILVNNYMQTNDPDIFAAGANVEFINSITGFSERWTNAPLTVMQANIVAEFLCGNKISFEEVVPCDIIKIFGYTVAMTGANENQLTKAKISHKHIYLQQNNCDIYMPQSQPMLFKLIFAPDGTILGLQGIGTQGIDARINIVAELIKKKASIFDLSRVLIAYAPPFSMPKDALNNLGNLALSCLNGKIQFFDVQNLSLEDVFLVDVRQQKSFEKRHLPNAINFPIQTIRDNLSSFPHDKKIVFYCNQGYGAYLAYCILRNRGFKNAYLLNTPYDISFDL